MRDRIWYMALVLGLVSVLAGLALAGVKRLTDPVIEGNLLEQAVRPALARLLGPLRIDNDALADRARIEVGRDARGRRLRVTVFRGRVGGRLVAAAMQTNGVGYGGELTVLTTFDLVKNRVSGVAVLDQRETKGLGARVAEPGHPFLRQFEGLAIDARFALDREGGEIDGLAGATITSRAVTGAVAQAATVLRARRAEIGR